MSRPLIVVLLALGVSGCVNMYHRIDTAPNSTTPLSFRGIEDHLHDGSSLHVVQIHGMGDHSSQNDCAEGSENLLLQKAIAERLEYDSDAGYGEPEPHTIEIDGTTAGTYSVRKFTDPGGKGDLYFSCVTWGETGRIVKQGMLELDNEFLEKNDNERHRAPLNRAAKRFVNRSFSDPIIYLGRMGPYIRNVVWKGIQGSILQHVQKQARVSLANADMQIVAQEASQFLRRTPVAIISDSMGSRIVFDVVCSKGGAYCQGGSRLEVMQERGLTKSQHEQQAVLDAALVDRLTTSVTSVYMLANQLPLLELAYVEPPTDGTSLETMIASSNKCYQPLLGLEAPKQRPLSDDARLSKIQLVAFTDVNDALSYHLTDTFKSRCTSVEVIKGRRGDEGTGEANNQRIVKVALPLEIINVTLPNARIRWLFLYSDLAKAHSSGFKENPRAIDYLVEGNN